MPEKFKWSSRVIAWLTAVILVCAVISYNMPEHPHPNETVLLPGYQFIDYSINVLLVSFAIAMIRKRTVFLNFEANWLESFIALNGVALFISPFVALLFRFVLQVTGIVRT
ncbi:MAG: hypothetical protein LBE24_07375 [Methylobacillus sp.]|jgi:hypothetical protein|nr:hypothetical protein [Methylobacillus sp.]